MANDIQAPTIYKVPESNMDTLRARIEKLNRAARKLSVQEIVIRELGHTDYPAMVRALDWHISGAMEPDPTGRIRRVFEITIDGGTPKIAGWEFIATIHPVTDEAGNCIGNEIRPVPGHTIPIQYREADLHCDHCHTSRFRKDVFVVRHEQGETKQIGRNCLRDFLGHANPEVYARWAEIVCNAADLCSMAEGDEGFGGGRRAVERFMLEDVLIHSACVIRTDGWRSRKTAAEFGTVSTSADVAGWLMNPKFIHERKQTTLPALIITDQDKDLAREVAAWMEALNERDLDQAEEYIYNLALIGRAHIVEARQIGLACSAVSAYLREQEREINRRKLADLHRSSEYIGEIGARVVLTLTLEFTRAFEGDYGTRHLYKFVDGSGNVVVWWASAAYSVAPVLSCGYDKGEDLKVGDTITVNATIKAHELRDGIRQTVVARCAQYLTKEEKKARKAHIDAIYKRAAEECA